MEKYVRACAGGKSTFHPLWFVVHVEFAHFLSCVVSIAIYCTRLPRFSATIMCPLLHVSDTFCVNKMYLDRVKY